MASKEAALDSKLQSLSRDDLIHFVKKQATQISKLKQNQLQQAVADSPPKPTKGGTTAKPLDGQSGGSSSGQNLSADVGQLVKQIEDLTTCKETLEETLKNSGDMINQLRRENESLKQESECFAMQKSTFMASLQMFEDEKQNLVKDLSTMTEARDEALKCLEHAKQAKTQTSSDSETNLQELLQERDDLKHLVNKLNRDLEYEKTLLIDERNFWQNEKCQLSEDLENCRNQLASVLEENEDCRVVIEDFSAKTCDLVEQLKFTKETLAVKAHEYSILEEKFNSLEKDSNTAVKIETNVEPQECVESSVTFDNSENPNSDAGSEAAKHDPASKAKSDDLSAIDSTESLKIELTDLKQKLLNVCNERAKLSEALKLTNQAKEETRAALETEKQMLSEKNFNLQTTNTYLTSKVMTMSKQLECIPEEQRSSPEEDVSMESIHSEDPANSSIGANETPNKSFECTNTSADVSTEHVNNLEHRLASINIVIAQLEKEKDELCRKELLSMKENEENIDQKEENSVSASVIPAEPDLVSSCIPLNERTGEAVQEFSGDDSSRSVMDSSRSVMISCPKCEEFNLILVDIKEERDCLLSQIETLKTHETDLIAAQSLLERKLEDLVSEKESIFLEVQGLIGDLNKYVSRNVDLENEKQRLSKLVTELGSSAEIVTVLKDSLQADKLILAEKDEQIIILEDQVSVLKDSVGQYKSRYDELETVLSEFETKFSEMEKNTAELQEKNTGSEEERVKLNEQLEVCQEAIVKFHSELDYQREENEVLKHRCDHMKHEYEQLIDKLKTTEDERDQLKNELLSKTEVVGQSADVAQQTEEVIQQSKELVQQVDECEVEEVVVLESEAIITQTTNQEEPLIYESEKLQDSCNQVEGVSVDVQTSEISIENLEKELDYFREKVNIAQMQLKEKESEIDRFKETLDSLHREKEKLESSFEEEKRLLFEDLEESRVTLETTKSAFAKELSTKDENINALSENDINKSAEIEELKEKIEELRLVKNELNEAKVDYEVEMKNITEQKIILEESLSKLESASQIVKEELSSEIEQLTNELSTKIQETESLCDQIEILKNGASTELTKIVEEKQNLFCEIQNLNEQLQSSHKEKMDILEKFKEDTEFMENEKEVLGIQNMQLQEELSNRANDINELKDAITNLESSLNELEVQYERVRDEKRGLSEKLTEVIDQSASEKLNLSEELQKLKSSSISRENSFSDLKTQHSDCSENIEKLNKQVETLQVEKNKLCGKLEDLEAVHEKELEKMQSETSRLQTLNEELKLQKNKVYDMYTELEETSVEKDKSNAELTDKVSRLEQEVENKKLKIETLAKDIQWHTENLDDMKNQLQQVFEESSSLKEKLSDSQLEKGNLGKELDNMKFQFEAFSQSDSRLRSDIAHLENVKIGIDHKYNLLMQEVDRFLNTFIDDMSDLLDVEPPSHEKISEVTQKIEFVDKKLKLTLSEFAVGAKETYQDKICLEKKLDASLKTLDNVGELLLDSENEVFETALEVKEIKRRSQKVESACKTLLKDRDSKNDELISMKEVLRSKDEELDSKNQELKCKDKEINSINAELEYKSEDLRVKKEELNSKDEELRSKNEELDTKNEDLRSKDEELKAKTEELNSKDEELNSLSEELNVKRSSLRSMEEKLSGEVVSLSAQVKTEKDILEAKLTESEAKNQKLRQLVLKVKKEHQTLKTDMEKEKENLSKLESDLAGKTEDCCSWEKSVAELQQQVQNLERDLHHSKEEKAYLEESIQTLHKDIDNAREVKCSLESDLESKNVEICRIKAEVMQGLESEIGKTQQVVEVLQSDLEKLSQQKIKMELEMTKRIEQKELEFKAEVERLKNEKENVEYQVEAKLKEIEQMKEEHEQKIKEVENRNSQGENDKQAMLDLEMADMRRSLESLKEKLESKSKETDTISGKLESVRNERDTLKKEKKDLDEKNAKFKQLLLKQKKELEELRKLESEWKTKESDYLLEITSHRSEIENLKMQTVSDAQSNVKLLEQISGLERRNITLTDLVDSLKEDLKRMEQSLETSTAEFEQYKARVHTVFKQQKEKSSNVEDSKILSAERDTLKTQLQYAKSQLSELGQDSEMLKLEKERLQKECQSLSLANNQLTQQMSQREITIKQKLDDLKFELEKKNNSFEIMESGYKNQISNLTKYYKEKLQSEEKEHQERLEKMEEQFQAQQQQQAKTQLLQLQNITPAAEEPLQIITSPLTYSTPIEPPPPVTSSKSSEKRPVIGRREPIGMERSDGDGVESDANLFSSSSASYKPSPKASQEFISFEKLISPSKPPSLHSQGQQSFSFENTLEPMSPTDSSSPISYSKRKTSAEMLGASSMTSPAFSQEFKKQHKKIAHLTSLLNESEMNIQRLTDQSQLLKDEVRRLEGSWDETAKNMEYLKNILIKFFKLPNGKEKEQLVPVLTMLLKLNNEEKSLIAQLSSDGNSGSEAVPAVSGWSSYMPRWSGLM